MWWFDALAFRGRFVFTLDDAAKVAGTTPAAAKLSIHRPASDGALFERTGWRRGWATRSA